MKLFTRNVKAHDIVVSRTDKLPDFGPNFDLDAIETDFIKNRFVNTIADEPKNKINPNSPIIVEDQETNPATPIDETQLADAFADWLINPDIDVDLESELKDLLLQTALNLPVNDNNYRHQLGINYLITHAPAGTSPVDILPTMTNIYTFSIDIRNQIIKYLADTNDDNYINVMNGFIGTLLSQPISRNGLSIAIKNHDHFCEIITKAQDYYVATNQISSKELDDVMIDLSKTKLTSIEAYNFNFDSDIFPYIAKALNDDADVIVPPINIKLMANATTFIVYNMEELSYLKSDSEFNAGINKTNNDIKSQLHRMQYASLKKISRAKPMPKRDKAHEPGKASKSGNLSQARQNRITTPTNTSDVKRVLNKLTKLLHSRVTTLRSENSIKIKRPTYQRASRRNPEDINSKGVIKKTTYNPDIHIYLDCSGSITEDMYSNGLRVIIAIAKLLKTDLYFSSFSHIVSKPSRINVAGKSTSEIYKAIKNIPKVGGGTQYENVWTSIDQIEKFNNQQRKASRLNFIITDFEYGLRDGFQFNPKSASVKNTYYLAMKIANQTYLKTCSEKFQKECQSAGQPNISKHII